MIKIKNVRWKLISALVFLLTPLFSLADQITENFTVYTSIERASFFDSKITAYLSDEFFYLDFDKISGSIKPVATKLIVKTLNIKDNPEEADLLHLVTLSKNNTQCYKTVDIGSSEETEAGSGIALLPSDSSTNNYTQNFTDIHIDGMGADEQLTTTQSLSFPFDAINEDGELVATHDVYLNFSDMPEEATRCRGEVSFLVEFDL